MSSDRLPPSLSIQSIASQNSLPVVIQSASDSSGSTGPIILHSISNIVFAFGRALKKVRQPKKSEYQSYGLLISEFVAIPLKYPGYFECLLPSSRGPQDGVVPEKSIRSIVERMQVDQRSQQFYIAAPLRVYTLETTAKGVKHRVWEQIEAHQMIVFEQLTHIEYTPTENDHLTQADYAYSWWFCFFEKILNRNEYVLKCIRSNQKICYIPCSSTDEVCLIPVGQRGSTDVYKLQTIENLIESFPLPMNIKLAEIPGSDVYKDFTGHLRLLGSHREDFAVCGSLSTKNVSLIPVNTPLKFFVMPKLLSSTELARCQMFIQSFDGQIRRILILSRGIPSHLSGSRDRSSKNDDHQKRPHDIRRQRAVSTNTDVFSPRQPIKRALSADKDSIYNLLTYPIQIKAKKSPQSSTTLSYYTENNLTKDIDLPNADGAILMNKNSALFLAVASANRLP